MYDAVVIGGGVIGVCSAHSLQQAGLKIALIEQNQICSGASYGNAGLLVPSHALPMASPFTKSESLLKLFNPNSVTYAKLSYQTLSWLLRFRKACHYGDIEARAAFLYSLLTKSLELYQEWVKKYKIQCHFSQKGWLNIFENQEIGSAILKEAAFLEKLGIPFESLTKEQVFALEPHISKNISGGMLYPQDSFINPQAFVTGLAATLPRDLIFEKTQVLKIHQSRGVFTIETNHETFRARKIVIATGAWSPILKKKLHIAAAKGYSLTIARPKNNLERAIYLAQSRVVATPMGSHLRFTSNLIFRGLDFTLRQQYITMIQRKVEQFLPGLEGINSSENWYGFRPCSIDGMPIIGESKDFRGVCFATGHGMIGLSLGPVTGQLVAEIVREQRPSFDLDYIHPDRF